MERLGDVVVGAEFEPLFHLEHELARREQDDGNVGRAGIVSEVVTHLKAVHHGHHDVADDQCRHLFQRQQLARLAVVGFDDLPVGRQPAADVGAQLAVVLHDEDRGFAPGRREFRGFRSFVRSDVVRIAFERFAVEVVGDDLPGVEMGVAAGDDHVERTAAALLRFGVDHAVVHLHDAFGQRESDARADALYVGVLRLVERVENAFQVPGVHADAVVRKREAEVECGIGIEPCIGPRLFRKLLAGRGFGPQDDAAAVGGEFEGVGQQVQQHLFEKPAVVSQRQGTFRGFEPVVDAVVAGLMVEGDEDLLGEAREIAFGDLGRH